MARAKRVTIKQVAEQAGVSPQTVSRVLNDRPDVASETRQRVKAVIERLGYQPSALARSLIQQRSYTLGVVIAGLKYLGPSRTLNGITDQAEELGYALLLMELSGFATNDVKPLLNSLLSRQVDGIIWAVPEVADNRNWLEERLPDLPVPTIFLTMGARSGASIVSVDNLKGGRIATEHLIQQGYRNIGHISGPISWWEARQRKEGWQQALRQAGFAPSDRYCVEGNWSSASGERAFLQLKDQYPEMDAVFVANDQMALSVLMVACQEGIKVPQEVAVVGFDGMPEAAYFWPPLTTVSQDQHLLGSTSVRRLVESIEIGLEEKMVVVPGVQWLQPQLLVRRSSVAP